MEYNKLRLKQEEINFIKTRYQDVDYVLTTRELARMIKECGINFQECDGEFEYPFGPASGAADIFFGL